jgi:hypothetical protein
MDLHGTVFILEPLEAENRSRFGGTAFGGWDVLKGGIGTLLDVGLRYGLEHWNTGKARIVRVLCDGIGPLLVAGLGVSGVGSTGTSGSGKPKLGFGGTASGRVMSQGTQVRLCLSSFRVFFVSIIGHRLWVDDFWIYLNLCKGQTKIRLWYQGLRKWLGKLV